jgi:hypothetical protein
MSETLKQVNEEGTVEVVRTRPLEVSALAQDDESVSVKKAMVMLLLLQRMSKDLRCRGQCAYPYSGLSAAEASVDRSATGKRCFIIVVFTATNALGHGKCDLLYHILA